MLEAESARGNCCSRCRRRRRFVKALFKVGQGREVITVNCS